MNEVFFLFALNLFFLWIIINTIKENFSIIKKIYIIVSLFVIFFYAISVPLIYFDIYSSFLALVIELALEACFVLVYVVISKDKLRLRSAIVFTRSELVAAGLFIIIASIFINLKSGRIALDSDQGGYFSHTMILAESSYSDALNLADSPFFDFSSDDNMKNSLPALGYHNNNYYIHGIPTWCSLMALFWNWRGMSYAGQATTLLFMIATFSVYYTVLNISKQERNSLTAFIVFAMTPLELYIAKVGLSEIAFMSITLFSVFLISEGQSFELCGIASMGLIFFIHISTVYYLPIFLLMIFANGYKKNNKKLIFSSSIIISEYLISLLYCYKVTYTYFCGQYERIVSIFGISIENYIFVAFLFGILLIGVQALFCYKKLKIMDILITFIKQHYDILFGFITFVIGFYTILYSYNMAYTNKFRVDEGVDLASWGQRNIYMGTGLKALKHLYLYNIVWATGIVLFIVFLINLKKISKLSNEIVYLYAFSIYAIFFFTVLNFDSPRNYYTSRYIAPVIIPFIIITACCIVKKKNICILAVLVLLSFNKLYYYPFTVGAPQLGQMQALEYSMSQIEAGESVVFDRSSEDLAITLALGLKTLNNNTVYTSKDLPSLKGKKAYFISDHMVTLTNFDYVSSKKIVYQLSMSGGDDGGYAYDVGYQSMNIFIYARK